ncbi:MAG: cbb3-type cytochrome c oxidase subunit I [Nitrospirae bacterium]|nr:cbb3-type cytochrome c oxidase subunit I [Nitrospirota bacterium]
MIPASRLFLAASFFYLALGPLLGLLIAADPGLTGWLRMPHAHSTLVGGYGMLIFAVAYHVLPRFTGRPLYSERLTLWHFYLANVSLPLVIIAVPLSWTVSSARVLVARTFRGDR